MASAPSPTRAFLPVGVLVTEFQDSRGSVEMSVTNPYRALFEAPGAKAFVITGFVARLPMAMVAIGIITMLSQLHGSFGLASTVSATYVITSALLAPRISRLVDLHGQGKVLPPAAIMSAAGLLALLSCTHWHAPDWALFASAVLAGFMPSMPAMVRARSTVLLAGTAGLRTAYAFESVLDEACFIVGPPLAVGLSVATFAQAGPLAAALLLAVGVLSFSAQRRSEPPVRLAIRRDGGTKEDSLLRSEHIRMLSLVMIGLGAITGAVDVFSMAFATQLGKPASASIVLSAYAGGSCGAGLLFGAYQGKWPLPRLLLAGGCATALSTLPLLVPAHSIGSLASALLTTGLCVAPTMIVAMSLAERNVPASRLTETLTWLITGLNLGIAAGAACAGWLIDAYDVQAGFGVALTAGGFTLVAACCAYRQLSRCAAAVRAEVPKA